MEQNVRRRTREDLHIACCLLHNLKPVLNTQQTSITGKEQAYKRTTKVLEFTKISKSCKEKAAPANRPSLETKQADANTTRTATTTSNIPRPTFAAFLPKNLYVKPSWNHRQKPFHHHGTEAIGSLLFATVFCFCCFIDPPPPTTLRLFPLSPHPSAAVT